MKNNLIAYTIPEWAICPLINADNSALNDEEEQQINNFCGKVAKQYGNANFMLGDIEGKDNLGFLYRNDIDNLGDNCYTLYIKPSNNL